MDIKELRTFITLAEQSNYLDAAARLNYAPSTLSKHVQLLEAEMGAKLVTRDGRRIKLTEEGQKFLTYARRMVEVYYDSMDAFAETAELKENIGIAGCEMSVCADLVPLFTDFSSRHPEVRFHVQTSANAHIADWVRRQSVEIGFLFSLSLQPVEGCRTIPLYCEPVRVMTTPHNLLSRRDSLTLSDLDGQRFAYTHDSCCLGDEFRRFLQREGVRPASTLFLSGLGVTLDYARRNNGVVIVPAIVTKRYAETEGLVVLPLRMNPIPAWMRIICREDAILTPGERALIRESRRFARRMAAEYPEVTLAEEEEEMAGGAIAARA